MSARVWLDDRRRMPIGYTHWVKTADEAIALLEAYDVEHISLDHDLGDEHYHVGPIDRTSYKEKTGYAVLEWMHEHDRWTADISVHSLNPKGAGDVMTKLRNRAPSHVVFRRVKPGEI